MLYFELDGPNLTYFVREDDTDSLTTLVVTANGHLQASIYFDHEGDRPTVEKLAASMARRPI